ncbi:MAG: hypothetical protein EBU84_12315 [Actinobacteria bacterium]|nr:hypothetical protein [Actinomycetota bacterium]
MATLISRGEDIGFTILPYSLDMPIHEELIAHPSDHVLGYITYNKETCERKFIYTESGSLTPIEGHWSLAILKEFPYAEKDGSWIVYSCSPQKAKLAFGKILSTGSLRIDNWDTWSVNVKDAKVAVITSCEIY